MRPQLHDASQARSVPDYSHIDTYQRALNGVLTITGELGIAHRRMVINLARVLSDMRKLAEEHNELTEATLRTAYEIAVTGMIDDLFPANDAVDFETLRRIESEDDRAEDKLQDMVGIYGLQPALLEDWGKAKIRASVSSKACGRRAIALARKLRSDKEVGRTVSLDRLQPEAR